MKRRTFAGLALALLVSGCVTGKEGTEYALVSRKIGPPKPGHSRVVFLSEKGSYGSGACELSIDNRTIDPVRPGAYAYADVPAGHHALVATQALFPGDTKMGDQCSGRTDALLRRSQQRQVESHVQRSDRRRADRCPGDGCRNLE